MITDEMREVVRQEIRKHCAGAGDFAIRSAANAALDAVAPMIEAEVMALVKAAVREMARDIRAMGERKEPLPAPDREGI